MAKTIDIHPHIIADDPKRYPLAPLGGHQSDWSQARPVTRRADDRRHGRGRGRQVRRGAGFDLLRPRQLVPRRRGRQISRPLHRGVLGRRARPRRAGKDAPLAKEEPHGHAALHHRQHHEDPGRVDRRPPRLPRLGDRRRARHSHLHADVRRGLPAARQPDAALPAGEGDPRSPVAAGAQRRPALCGGREPVRARRVFRASTSR